MKNLNINPQSTCPCCSEQTYQDCCLVFHSESQLPDTPEQLMRSRFCAFYLGLNSYLIDTHHPDFLDGLTEADLAQEPLPEWLSLDVIASEQQGDSGYVTFQAWYKLDGQLDAIHEHSSFEKLAGRWLYTEGKQKAAILPKRNEPCVCRSGKKFKQCCSR